LNLPVPLFETDLRVLVDNTRLESTNIVMNRFYIPAFEAVRDLIPGFSNLDEN
jgi:hypothetical protein